MFLSTTLSAVRSAVFTLPDCHNPPMTSTAPLSLDPPSKVVPSISPLTQWQQPVLVGFFFFLSCDCDWWSFQFVNGIGECLQRLKQYHPSPHISGAQLARLASPDRRSCCGFSQRAHSLIKVLLYFSYCFQLLRYPASHHVCVPSAESFDSLLVSFAKPLSLLLIFHSIVLLLLSMLFNFSLTWTSLSSPSLYLFIYGAEYLHLFWLKGYLLMMFKCCWKSRLLEMRQNMAPDFRKHNKSSQLWQIFAMQLNSKPSYAFKS